MMEHATLVRTIKNRSNPISELKPCEERVELDEKHIYYIGVVSILRYIYYSIYS